MATKIIRKAIVSRHPIILWGKSYIEINGGVPINTGWKNFENVISRGMYLFAICT